MATGKLLQFDPARGYGFVAADDGGEDVFLHAFVFYGDLSDLVPGIPLEFQIMAGDRGRKAFSVSIVEGKSAPLPPRVLSAPGRSRVGRRRSDPSSRRADVHILGL